MIDKIIKVFLAAILFLCLLDMPYDFYQLIRFLALIGFFVLGYRAYEKKRKTESIIYFSLALLFQPLFKIALGRELWNIIDVLVGIGIFVSVII